MYITPRHGISASNFDCVRHRSVTGLCDYYLQLADKSWIQFDNRTTTTDSPIIFTYYEVLHHSA